MEDFFRECNVPDNRKVRRAKENASSDIYDNWLTQAAMHGHAWEGFKRFLEKWYTDVRENLARVRWKGPIERLQQDTMAAVGACEEFAERERIEALAGRVPDALHERWVINRRNLTTWQQVTSFLQDAEYDIREGE